MKYLAYLTPLDGTIISKLLCNTSQIVKLLLNKLGKKTALTQFIKEGFHPVISHHRAHQPGLQKSRPFVHERLLSALIILWWNTHSGLLTDWTVNCFLCTCGLWLREAGYCSPGTRGPPWPAHLGSLLPPSPDSSHERRNRACRRSSLSCQESASCEQIQVLGNKQCACHIHPNI